MKFVLAATATEFEQWRVSLGLPRVACCYVRSPEILAGKSVGRGDVVELPGFRGRADADAIDAALVLRIHATSATEGEA